MDLSKMAGFSHAHIWRYLTGKSDLTSDLLFSLCRVLGVDPLTSLPLAATGPAAGPRRAAPVLSDASPASTDIVRLPLAGQVIAGRPVGPTSDLVVMDDWHDADIQTLAIDRSMFSTRAGNDVLAALSVSGDSMAPDYRPGDVVVVELTSDLSLLRPLDHVVIDLGAGAVTLKVWCDGQKPILQSINPQHQPFLCPKGARLIGVALGLVRRYQ